MKKLQENLIASQIPYPEPSGIVATGLPESGEKKLTFCDKCGELKVKGDVHECHYVPENLLIHDIIKLLHDSKSASSFAISLISKYNISELNERSVSPPPQESDQKQLWDEVLNTCETHVINDIRLLEKLSKQFILTRKP